MAFHALGQRWLCESILFFCTGLEYAPRLILTQQVSNPRWHIHCICTFYAKISGTDIVKANTVPGNVEDYVTEHLPSNLLILLSANLTVCNYVGYV